MLDVETGTETKLQAGGEYFWPRFSPDGRWIAFAQGVTPALRLIGADGSNPHVLASGFASEDITWSPDSSKVLAFSSDLATLDIIPLDGGQIVAVDSLGNEGAPSWQRVP